MSIYYHGEPAAVQAMASDDTVSVYELRNGVTVFAPEEPLAGFIFYPGGKVKHTAYGTWEVVIDGGCHTGFGRYGAQDGDGTPTISSDEQIDRTAEEIARMMGLLPQ